MAKAQPASVASFSVSFKSGSDESGGKNSSAEQSTQKLVPITKWSQIDTLHNEFIDMDKSESFEKLLLDVQEAMALGIYPERTFTGSSGSYFVKLTSNESVAIFKPSDEEPYAEMNPRWIKWLHRTLCPCLFGRGCLVPNGGAQSEVMASVVDRFFKLYMVPRTELVQLQAPSFSYPYSSPVGYWREHPKKGSFQVFVTGFEAAEELLPGLEMLSGVNHHFGRAFQGELERLIVLDWIIRNTDRTLDNWMVKVLWIDPQSNSIRSECLIPPINVMHEALPIVKLAAIDNGLAFPWKHPTDFRTYPYSWSSLPQCRIPFSQELRDSLLPFLNDYNMWIELSNRLISVQPKSSAYYLHHQLGVLRGQMLTLKQCLECKHSTPADLLEMPLLRVELEGNYFQKTYGKSKSKGGFKENWSLGLRMWVKQVEDRGSCSIW